MANQNETVDNSTDVLFHSISNSDADYSVRPLPEFTPISAPTFVWGDVDGESCVNSINCSYDKVIIHW